MTRPAPIIAGTLAALLLLFGAYMGSYYALLGGEFGPREFDWNSDNVAPLYWWRHPAIEFAFKPAHSLDKLLFQTYWRDPTVTRWSN